MLRIITARRQTSAALSVKTVQESSLKTAPQATDKPERHVFRDISNLPPSNAGQLNKQHSFRSAKAFAKKPPSKKGCENAPPVITTTATEASRSRVGTGKVRKSKWVLPEKRWKKRVKIQGALGGCERGKRAKQECDLPPFVLNILEDVETMEFSALKEELTSMEEESPPTESRGQKAGTENDPMLMSEYSADIYRYLKSSEFKCVMPTSYLTGPAITPTTRAVLVNWLVQVQVHLELSEETLHLTVILLDRFLSREPITLNFLQLLGVSCLFVASKYEERFAPEVDVLCMLTDYTYTSDEILLMERRILSALEFDLFNPTPMAFLELFVKADANEEGETHDTKVTFHLANYLLDLALIDTSVLKFYPSERAAAAACLALHITQRGSGEDCWTANLVDCTGYTEQQLVDCMAVLAKLVSEASRSQHKASTEKFASPSYGSVSCLPDLTLTSTDAELLMDSIL